MCRHPQDSEGTGILWTLKILAYSGLWRDGYIPDCQGNVIFWTFTGAGILRTLKGRVWAPYARGAYAPLHITSPARDTQYCTTSPEPVLSVLSEGTDIFLTCQGTVLFWTFKGAGIFWTVNWGVYYGLWRHRHILDTEGTGILLICQGTVIFWTFKIAGIFWSYSSSYCILFRDWHIRIKKPTQMSSSTAVFLTLKRLAYSEKGPWHILNSEWTGIFIWRNKYTKFWTLKRLLFWTLKVLAYSERIDILRTLFKGTVAWDGFLA
jgi:hypothetical protein